MRVILTIGHSYKSQGARRVDTGESEFEFNRAVAREVMERRPEVAVLTRASGPYKQAMRSLTRTINTLDPDMVVELHFNSCSNPTVQRGEVLFWPKSEQGKKLAVAVSDAWAKKCGQPSVAVGRKVSWSGAPLYFLRDTAMPALILEPFYGSGEGVRKYTVSHVADMVEAALDALDLH